MPGRPAEAFRLAQANLQARGGPAVVEIFTDGAFEPPILPDLGGATLHWHRYGQRGRNVGITAFEARKTFFGAFDYQAFLSVANYSGETVAFDLTLTLDGRPLKTERVTLTPELKRSFVFPFTDRDGGDPQGGDRCGRRPGGGQPGPGRDPGTSPPQRPPRERGATPSWRRPWPRTRR